ncbi:MAG: DNA primase [Bacteroidetes bacterium]|nr:DNA primase [Bacteroidota bacterium]MCA6443249.1 DNA primase [Bacteroidota bacterium]
MIPKNTVDTILETARVEEVIGDFITLKKRGANLLGLCPFHGEKTPSFTVSPAKNIYKCFGCGKAGSPVNFIMDQLTLSYPEALKWLAKKYGIEVVEKELTIEEKEAQTERESMYIVMSFSQRYFSKQMNETDEGRSVGLGYFLQRQIPIGLIDKFGLGYSLENRRQFTDDAIQAGYKPKYLVSTGMCILSNAYVEGEEIKANHIFDRYAGRVMFPIHDVGGRVVGFGGRTLSNDKKVAKYINSPETDIYNKSKVLYGLWFAKSAIQKNDKCFLVEGYMDVIAMHQAGFENVVASSGTSLTVEQIKAIHRYTTNVVVLYDGDEAGQKASARAIPMLLEEGMNVRLLYFPNNDDPDSYYRKVTHDEFTEYVNSKTEDFLYYTAKKLNEDSSGDPIKKASVIKTIVSSIALIPDNIIRSIYVKECARIMEIDEPVLLAETNKIRVSAKKQAAKNTDSETVQPATEGNEVTYEEPMQDEPASVFEAEEKELLRLLLAYGNAYVTIEAEDENLEKFDLEITLGEYIFFELMRDSIKFENPIYSEIYEEYVNELSQQRLPNLTHFSNHPNPLISSFVVNHVHSNYELSSKWKLYGVLVPNEIQLLKKLTQSTLFSYKARKLNVLINESNELLKINSHDKVEIILKELTTLNTMKQRVNKLLGRVVIK